MAGINFSTWDFKLSSYDNMVASIIAENSFYATKLKRFKDSFTGVKDGKNVGRINIANWFHREFGNEKPLCLWDKLMRELGRIGTQINDEVDRFSRRISAEYDRVSQRVGDELQREIEDVLDAGEKITDTLNDAWDDLTDGIFGGCFITTATLLSFGEDDDNCYELTLIRKFRDTYLIKREHGDCIIKTYYELAPKIVERIGKNHTVYTVIWDMYLEPFCCAIENDENEKALDIYLTMVEVLKVKYGL